MCDFSKRYSLEFENVVTFRGVVTQSEAMHKLQEIVQIITDYGSSIAGPVLTCTHEAYDNDSTDFEIIVPSTSCISVEEPFLFRESFILNNCLKVVQEGNPHLIQTKIKALYDFIRENGLTPLSHGYTLVNQNEATRSVGVSMISEFYVPVDI